MDFLFSILLALFGGIYQSEKGTVTVTIEGIKKAQGSMVVGLFDNENDFTVTPVIGISQKISKTGSVVVTFKDVPYKTYAISVYHDLNDNGELEKNGLGIPTEPYGFSNNPTLFGPPSFKKSTFEFKEKQLAVVIQLR